MDNLLFPIILANLLVSLGSLVGIFTLSVNFARLEKILKLCVALAAGTMLGTAFLHLLPESAEHFSQPQDYLFITLMSFIFFFLIERILHWRHCHESAGCDTHHKIGIMNLLGDCVHNFMDGLVIAAAFMTEFHLGVLTTLAISLHEIPQEIGDFGVLLYSGFTKRKALLFNLLVGLASVVGGLTGYLLRDYSDMLMHYLLPIAAGGFIYISASDLLPEIRDERNPTRVFVTFLFFILGVLLVYGAQMYLPEGGH